MLIKNAWYVAGFASDIGHEIRPIRMLDQPLIVWRAQDGEVIAMEDSCPHRRVPLAIGSLLGDEVRCGYHGLQFDRAGRCTKVPGQSRPHPTARVRTYPALERHGLMWVWFGAAELANPDQVPDLHWLADPAWMPVTGYLHVKADYRLLTDNLMDLSHETYIHSHTIGNDAVADNPVEVEMIQDRMVRAHREMPNHTPPPFIANAMNYSGKIHRWQTAIYMPPGMHMTEAGLFPVATPRENALVTRVLHLLTPETAHSTHYFWASCRSFRLDDAKLSEMAKVGLDMTFDEDRVVLELQENRLREEGYPNIPVAALKVDEAPVRARRLLASIIEKEQADSSFTAPPIVMISDRADLAA